MAQTIKLRRSASQGAIPTVSQLSLGEIAINTHDGILYIKKDDGTESIVTLGSGSSDTAAELLTKIKTVDGVGSGLDADTVDGVQSSQIIYGNSGAGTSEGTFTDWNSINKSGFYSDDDALNKWSTANWSSVVHHRLYSSNNRYATQLGFDTYNNNLYTRTNNNDTWTSWEKIWHSGVDGSGSGLDADLLDGQHGSYYAAADSYLPLAGGTMTGKISMFQNNEIFGLSGTIANYPRLSFNSSEGTHSAKTQTLAGDLIGQIDFNPYTGTSYTGGGKISFISTEIITSSERGTEARIYSTKTGQSFLSFHQFKDDELYIKNVGGATHKYWHAGNDGGGSGLDADKLDGQQGSYYAAASHVHSYLPLSGGTLTGELKVNAPLTIENPVGTGRVEIGTIRNDQQNGYVRGSIIMSRDEDQITYNGTTDLWVHAGGGSTDWSMISHTTAGTNFYTGPTVSAETTYTNTAFDTAYRWLSVSNSSHVATFKSRPKVGTNNIWHSGDFANNSANWNTAYGWGDHSTQSYATQSYVGTQISNLVDSSPATLDTLNELAAALGDDPNFATTVTNSIATKLPLSGGTLTGALTATNFVQSGSLGNSFYGASFTRSAGGTTTPDIWGANGTLVLGTSASVEAVAFSGANARFYGNVGIGTSSPTAKADLVGGDVTGGLKISADKTTSAFFAFGADANETRITSSSYGGFKPLTVHTGGAERMRIDSAGNVGIGTSSPTAKLEVTGVPNATIQPSNAIIKMNSSGGNGLYMGNVGASTYASYIQAAFVSADIPNVNYNLLLQPNGGNVGIGTSSPNYPLDVRNSSDINQTFRVFYPDASTVEIGTSRMSTGVQQGLFVNAQTLIKFGISGIEKARINSAGNLGIGTNSPMAKLHVDGAIVSEGGSFTSSQETATDAGLIIQKNDYIYSDDSDYLRRIIGHASTGIIEIGQGGTALISDITLKPGSTGNIRFFGSGSEDVRINSAGNMGIGTTVPVKELHVDGTFVAEGGARSNPAGINNAVVIDYQQSGANTGRIRSRDWDGAAWRDFSIEAANINLLPSGNGVGIGTNYPTARLDVRRGDASGKIAEFHNNVGYGVDIGSSTAVAYISSGYNQRLDFKTDPSSGQTERMSILGNGHVGIGTTAPKAKLQVEEYGVDTTATSTAAITQVAIDSFPAVDFRSARYTIQVTNTTDGTYHLTELFMIHDGTTTNTSEFGSIFTGAAVEATFDADILSGNVRLLATPTSTDAMAFKVVRHSITV